MFIGSGLALGIGIGVAAGMASASSIADLGTNYDTPMLGFYSNSNGFLGYEGTAGLDSIMFFDDTPAVLSIFGTVSDPFSFVFGADFDLSGTDEVSANVLADSIVGTNSLQYLFEDGPAAYLVTITLIQTPRVPLSDATASIDFPIFDPNATVTVDKYTNVAPIPLPATMPLILAGLGGLAYLRRRAVS
ncbi:MAG: VPLPA-CTERM sorting domain-containing protein [Pseudomonadota bacterium]